MSLVHILTFVIVFVGCCNAFMPRLQRAHAVAVLNSRLHLSAGNHEDVGKVALQSTDGYSVSVHPDSDTLADALCDDFLRAAKESISRHGKFFVAVPGGSVLKMLGNLKKHSSVIDYSKVFMFYVNHKSVPNTDPTATHLKAKKLFLDSIPAIHAFAIPEVSPGETKGHDTDAHGYEKIMRSTFSSKEMSNDLPVFDYMLLGMGSDGHVGSMYPSRPRDTLYRDSDRWVLTVDKKTPASISLSLPVMNNAREVRIVLAGADKAEAVLTGVTRSKATVDFPACGVTHAKWMIDDAASKLLKGRSDVKMTSSA